MITNNEKWHCFAVKKLHYSTKYHQSMQACQLPHYQRETPDVTGRSPGLPYKVLSPAFHRSQRWRLHQSSSVWKSTQQKKKKIIKVREKIYAILKVAEVVLVLPHSNADLERLFSIVRKSKNDTRMSLKLAGAFSPILAMRSMYPESGVPCLLYQTQL